MSRLLLRRRTLLGAACVALPAWSQNARAAAAATTITIAQVVDTSPREQDVTKDFLVGARAAWQDINARGGVRGRPVQHLEIAVDATPAGVQQAATAVRENQAIVALSGSVGDPLATALCARLKQEDAALAHAAPWLQNAGTEIDTRTFPVFSSRQDQIAHALKTLTVSGIQSVGAVFASARDASLYREDVVRAAGAAKLRLVAWNADAGLPALAQHLGPESPPVLLFVGGTPELVQFTQGLERQSRQRYVVALGDVNLQTVHQMGGGRTAPVIATQPVPLVTASLPIVRRYREVLARLYDEAPVALSLAGFIAAHYTFAVLQTIDGPVTRASVLAAFQRQRELDLGGFRVSLHGQRRGAGYVTQSMLTADGRVVG